MKNVKVMLFSLFMSLLVLAGCQQQQASGPSPAVPADDSKPVTPKVNRVVLALGVPGSERPRPTDGSTPDQWAVKPAYEYLWGVSIDGEPNVPQLATEWNLEPDGQSYRFKLRKGVQFHNGKGEFTAKDVLTSWALLTAPDSLERRERWLATVPKIDVINDYEVVFHLSRPDQAFLWSFGEADAGLEIVSKADAESRTRWSFEDRAVAGTGPYAIKEWRPSEFIRFERVPFQHYRKAPDFPEFEFRFMKENSTRLAALLAKEVQIAALPTDLIPQAERQGMKSIRSRADVGFQTFLVLMGPWINKKYVTTDPEPVAGGQPYRYMDTPLLDGKVRKAMNKAINRDELNKAYFKGQGKLIYNTFFHPSRPGWNPDWERRFPAEYGYDVEAAKRLLAEAGYGPNTPMKHTILANAYGLFPELGDMVESIAGYWRAAGIQVTIDTVDLGIQTQKRNAQEYSNHSFVGNTAVRQFFGMGSFGAPNGFVGSRAGAEFIEPTAVFQDQLRWTLDPAKADALWRQVGDMTFALQAPIPLFWLPTYAVVDPNIVADYAFSGTITGLYTNVEYIRAAK